MSSRPSALAAAALLSLALLAGAAPSAAVVPPVPAVPPDYVVDLAGVVDGGSKTRLDAVLRELEEKTTAQVVVLSVDSLEGRAIEEFSVDLAHNVWKLGQKGRDNGVLITVAVKDRRYRIEVGYGLEQVLPDSLVGTIGRERLVPAFRQGDFGGGLAAAALDIAERVAAAAGVRLSGLPEAAPLPVAAPPPALPGPLVLLLGALLLIGMVVLFIKNPGLFLMLLLSSGRGGGWGGRGGGGGGGFGGGGGGGFGGGGASGSW